MRDGGTSGRKRADQLLTDLGLARTRSQARALIMAGRVLADGEPVRKAGDLLEAGAQVRLRDAGGYVSRGGYKLEGALLDLGLDPAGCKVLDVGASTGGFTDCVLQKGARAVTAVDVGYGLLDWRLRQDPRVTVVERTNARNLTPAEAGEGYDLALVDVSFISLTLILPPLKELLRPGGLILALVKPQFEVGKGRVGKGGVVRDPALQQEAVDKIKGTALNLGLEVRGQALSRLKGPKGNQEHFLLLAKPSGDQ
ncbi:MAG: TlyA family RNA methyltransferase [Thermodesulfobacteriota bacterium]